MIRDDVIVLMVDLLNITNSLSYASHDLKTCKKLRELRFNEHEIIFFGLGIFGKMDEIIDRNKKLLTGPIYVA